MSFLMHLLIENSINYLYPTLAMQTLSSEAATCCPNSSQSCESRDDRVSASWEHVPSGRGILYHLLKKGVHQARAVSPALLGAAQPRVVLLRVRKG